LSKTIYDTSCEFLALGVYLPASIICFIISEETSLSLNLRILLLDLIAISNSSESSFGLFVSSIGGSSNPVKVIAFVGHIAAQCPHIRQSCFLITDFLFSIIILFTGQSFLQSPHPMQSSLSTSIICWYFIFIHLPFVY